MEMVEAERQKEMNRFMRTILCVLFRGGDDMASHPGHFFQEKYIKEAIPNHLVAATSRLVELSEDSIGIFQATNKAFESNIQTYSDLTNQITLATAAYNEKYKDLQTLNQE